MIAKTEATVATIIAVINAVKYEIVRPRKRGRINI